MKHKEAWKSRKLRDEDIAGILYLGREGSATQRQIAELYRVTQCYVSRIISGKTKRTAEIVP